MIYPENQSVNVGIRIGAMAIDHFIMSVIGVLFFMPVIISLMTAEFNQPMSASAEERLTYIGMIGFALYFCKDIFNGRSIAKRILKLQVVDNKTGLPASPLQCLVRDLFCVLWMVEGIVAIVNPARRIGDRVAGTKLVPYDPTAEQPRTNIIKVLLAIFIAYGLMAALTLWISLPQGFKGHSSANTYNQAVSKDLEKLLTDSLGTYITSNVEFFDATTNDLQYIMVIAQCKEDCISNDDTYEQLRGKVKKLLYSRFPKETFDGRLKCTYRAKGQFLSKTTFIGKGSY